MNHSVASTWKRLFARSLDQFFLVLIMGPILFFLPRDSEGWLLIRYETAVALVLIPLFYEALFCYLLAATPGKWIFGLKVVPFRDGQHRHWGVRMLLRAVAGYLTLFFSWAVYATAFWRRDRRHLCDWLAETMVVGSEPVGPLKARPILMLFLIALGGTSGWNEAHRFMGQISYNEGFFRVPDMFQISFEVSLGDDED